ncbi:uracil-5--methyltransferase TRM9 [Aulographum hederae CBS 113979]|uniref:Uracil-5--methyltransferase TRM9 n=1 Tax=Aulographum hederae CBS 113979 TaxID=1176131 RepID=A0A6G1HD99_9PEZI|nr:uracil-5--methyltransferase TRM9 [Aulographum hederae CBS 113979]
MSTQPPDSSDYESEHVHQVYEQIASHFSSTRYKPWPIVERFLLSLPDGSIGLDIGCGNGKYLSVNKNVYILASDRSTNLTKIASTHQPHSALVADTIALPHKPASFDFAISIAVVHHLSTPERRREAIHSILALLRRAENGKEAGKALIYVWALEQKDSRRGWDSGNDQDVLVPWVMKEKRPKQPKKNRSKDSTADEDPTKKDENVDLENNSAVGPKHQSGEKTFHRYYHLYRSGELEQDITHADGLVLDSGYEKDNWWAIASPKS